jgi:hypothetical protein
MQEYGYQGGENRLAADGEQPARDASTGVHKHQNGYDASRDETETRPGPVSSHEEVHPIPVATQQAQEEYLAMVAPISTGGHFDYPRATAQLDLMQAELDRARLELQETAAREERRYRTRSCRRASSRFRTGTTGRPPCGGHNAGPAGPNGALRARNHGGTH